MDFYLKYIYDFIADLEQYVVVIGVKEQEGLYIVETDKLFVFIYLPDIIRLERDQSKPVIHLDIDLIIQSKAKIINRICGLHGKGSRIYARQTVVARIDKKITMSFQEEHHLQIAMPGKYRYGLYYQGELVSIAVFSGGRLMRNEGEGYRSFELIRFCHKGNVLVVGGLSKLIKAFVKDFNPQDIMTYADLDWTNDSSLTTIGFNIVGRLEPQVYYIEDGVRTKELCSAASNYYIVNNRGSLKLKLKF